MPRTVTDAQKPGPDGAPMKLLAEERMTQNTLDFRELPVTKHKRRRTDSIVENYRTPSARKNARELK